MAPKKGSAFLAGATPRVLAHRGLAVGAPENTLLAFAKALSLGVKIIETDIWVSSDGTAVISHDGDLKRLTGRNLRVDQMTASELRRIDLGEGQGFSSLADALDAFPEALFNIDLKTDAVVPSAITSIRDLAASDRVLVTSFSEKRRLKAIASLPGVATSLSFQSAARLLLSLRLRRDGRTKSILSGIDAIQIPERWRALKVLSPDLISAAHAAGVEVHVWTVNDAEDMRRLLSLGVDGIVTDRADIAVEVLGSRLD